ncbi:MAG: HNH endonuclease [Candidatus Hydrogenedentes bacterium]|nr:HNH endonuclease [Candidatus Hydrogenedentota bacterium]
MGHPWNARCVGTSSSATQPLSIWTRARGGRVNRRAPRPCTYPGCPRLVQSGRVSRCPQHERQRHREVNARRDPNVTALYHTARWRRSSRSFLADHPWCAMCHRAPATCVDHIVPHDGDPTLFWDRSNWQAACIECNSRKHMRARNPHRRTPDPVPYHIEGTVGGPNPCPPQPGKRDARSGGVAAKLDFLSEKGGIRVKSCCGKDIKRKSGGDV